MPGDFLGSSSETPPAFEKFKFSVIGKPPTLLERISNAVFEVTNEELSQEIMDVFMADNTADSNSVDEGLAIHSDEPSLLQRINLASELPHPVHVPSASSVTLPTLSSFTTTGSSSFGSVSTLVAPASQTTFSEIPLDNNITSNLHETFPSFNSPTTENDTSSIILPNFFSPSTICGNVFSETSSHNRADSFFRRSDSLSPLSTLLREEKNAWGEECSKRDREKNKFAEELEHWEQQRRQLKNDKPLNDTHEFPPGNPLLRLLEPPKQVLPSCSESTSITYDCQREKSPDSALGSIYAPLERVQSSAAGSLRSPVSAVRASPRASRTTTPEQSTTTDHQKGTSNLRRPEVMSVSSDPLAKPTLREILPLDVRPPISQQLAHTPSDSESGTNPSFNSTDVSQLVSKSQLPGPINSNPSKAVSIDAAKRSTSVHIERNVGSEPAIPSILLSKNSTTRVIMADNPITPTRPLKRPRDFSTDPTTAESSHIQKHLRIDNGKSQTFTESTVPTLEFSSRLDESSVMNSETLLPINVPTKQNLRDSIPVKAEIEGNIQEQLSMMPSTPFSDAPVVKKFKEDTPVISFKDEYDGDDDNNPTATPQPTFVSQHPIAEKTHQDTLIPTSTTVLPTRVTNVAAPAQRYSAPPRNESLISAPELGPTTDSRIPPLPLDQPKRLARHGKQQEDRHPEISRTSTPRVVHLPLPLPAPPNSLVRFRVTQHWSPGVDDDGGSRIYSERTPSPLPTHRLPHHQAYGRSITDVDRRSLYRGVPYPYPHPSLTRHYTQPEASTYVPDYPSTNSSRHREPHYSPNNGRSPRDRSYSPPPSRLPPNPTIWKIDPRRIPTPPPASEHFNGRRRLGYEDRHIRSERAPHRDYRMIDDRDRFGSRRDDRYPNYRDHERDSGDPYRRERSASPRRIKHALPPPPHHQVDTRSNRGPTLQHSNERDDVRFAPAAQEPSIQNTVQRVATNEQANDSYHDPQNGAMKLLNVVGRPPINPLAYELLQSNEDDDLSPSKRLMSMELLYPPSEKGDAEESSASNTVKVNDKSFVHGSFPAECFLPPSPLAPPPRVEEPYVVTSLQESEPPALLGRINNSEKQVMTTHDTTATPGRTDSQERIVTPHRNPPRGSKVHPGAKAQDGQNVQSQSGKELLSRIDMDVEKQSPHQPKHRLEGPRSHPSATQEPQGHLHRRRTPSAKASLTPKSEKTQEPNANPMLSLSQRIKLAPNAQALHNRISK